MEEKFEEELFIDVDKQAIAGKCRGLKGFKSQMDYLRKYVECK